MPGIKEILGSFLWNEWMNEFVVEWVYIHFPPGAWLVCGEVAQPGILLSVEGSFPFEPLGFFPSS